MIWQTPLALLPTSVSSDTLVFGGILLLEFQKAENSNPSPNSAF